MEYEADLTIWRDTQSLMSTQFMEGEMKGIEKGEANKEKYAEERAREKEWLTKLEMAKKCKQKGLPLIEIAELTGLSEDQINQIEK